MADCCEKKPTTANAVASVVAATVTKSGASSKSGLLVGGGLVAGLLASVCCVGPLILTILGVSGAAVLTKFEFLRWPMIGAVAILFGVAGRNLYRKRNACQPGELCADPKTWRKLAIGYWLGLVVALGAVTSPYWVNWFVD